MQRYKIGSSMAFWAGAHESSMIKSSEGDYVLHSEAQAEIDRLQAEVVRWKEAWNSSEEKYERTYKRWQDDTKTARNDALEEAAKWCEENGMAINLKKNGPYAGYVALEVVGLNAGRHEGMGYAAAIRALKRPTS